MDNGDLKRNIERLREERKLTQEQVADRIGVVRNTYRNIEKGDTRLISDHLLKIADVLETTPEALIIGYQPDEHAQRGFRSLREEYDRRSAFEQEQHRQELEEKDRTIAALRKEVGRLEQLLEAKEVIISLLRNPSQPSDSHPQ